jgi:hypothetical protein
MTERDEPNKESDGEKNPPSPYLPEDESFPESFRKIWRVLLAPWNRR